MPNGEASGLVYGGVPGTGLATVLPGITTKKPLDIFLEQKKERQAQETKQKAARDKWLDDVLGYSPESWHPFTQQIQSDVELHIDEGARINDMPEGEAKRQAKIEFAKNKSGISVRAKKSFQIKGEIIATKAALKNFSTDYPSFIESNAQSSYNDRTIYSDTKGTVRDINEITNITDTTPEKEDIKNWDKTKLFTNINDSLRTKIDTTFETLYGSLGTREQKTIFESAYFAKDKQGNIVKDDKGKPIVAITPEILELAKEHPGIQAYIDSELKRDSTLSELDALTHGMKQHIYYQEKVTRIGTGKYPTKKGAKKVNVVPATGEIYNMLNVDQKTGKVTTLPAEAIRVWNIKAIKATIPPREMWSPSEDARDKNLIGDYDVDILQVYEYWVDKNNIIITGRGGKLRTDTTGLRKKKFAKISINDTKKLKGHYLNQMKKLGGDPDLEKETDKPEIKKLRGRIEKLENEISEDITVERFIPYEQVKEKILSGNILGEIEAKPETKEIQYEIVYKNSDYKGQKIDVGLKGGKYYNIKTGKLIQ